VASALLFAWWTGVASAATTTGTLEICKSGDNGATGQNFNFSVARGQNTVGTVTNLPGGAAGGSNCATVAAPSGGAAQLPLAGSNGPIKYKITETNGTGNTLAWQMVGADVPAGGGTATLNATSQIVTVTLDQNAPDTAVVITNSLQGSFVKICKVTSTQAFVGGEYDFTISPAQGTQQNPVNSAKATAGTATAPGTCSDLIPTQQGSIFTISENPVNPPEDVVSITKSGRGKINADLKNASVTVTAGSGLLVITFDNEPHVTITPGLLEICKTTPDPNLAAQGGTFTFGITDANGKTVQSGIQVGLPAGGTTNQVFCTSGISLNPGTYTVTETIPANEQLVSVTKGPNSDGGIGLVNTTNGTAVVTVVANGDTEAIFANALITTQLKVCKNLPAGSEALQGVKFNFTVTDNGFPNGTSYPVSVTVPTSSSPGPSSQCSIVTDANGNIVAFPIGSVAKVVEANSRPFVDAGSGLGQNDTERTTIVSGINMIDFTNTAFGQLEVCKFMANGDPSFGQTFTFRYQNTVNRAIKGTITTGADPMNNCSFPVAVPAGTYTVTEDLSGLTVTENDGTKVPVFQFVASDARGPFGDSRCVPPVSYSQPRGNPPAPPAGGGCGNPATVTVPFFDPMNPASGETNVTFWNSVIRAQVKICKTVTSDSTATLRGNTWTYTINTSDGFSSTAGPLANGACTGLIGNFPVAVGNGVAGCTASMCPQVVTVKEDFATGPQTNWFVSAISVSGGYDVSFGPNSSTTNPTSGQVNFHAGPGPNDVFYFNTACSLATGCPPRG